MFWRFGGYASVSTIDTLLDKPDVTLEELLDEPEIIQELKQLNTKLIEYLREDHVLKRLMDYVIAPSLITDDEENDEDDSNAQDDSDKDKDAEASAEQTEINEKEGDPLKDILDPEDLEKVEKSRLKHSYIACEILSSETWSILESMMANPSYLRDFWGFLRRSPPLDSLQASYFTKVNETLLDKKTEEMLAFLKSLDGIVEALLQHVDNPMVMDLLLKIISLEKAEGGQGTVDWLKSQNLIPTLLSYLSPDRPASVQTSAGDFLKAIITISANASPNDQSCIGPNSLTRQLVSTECVQQLIDAMLRGGNPLTVGVGIVIEVIRKNNSDYDPENIGGPDTMLTTYDPIYLGTLLRLFAKHIPQFMALIQSSQHTIHDGTKLKTVERGKLSSAWGGQIEPLGFDRFKTCELMAELLHCSNMGLLNEPGSDEYVKQRDEERERLIREGVFDPHHDERSGVDYNDTTVDFTNESALGSGSPEDIKITEAPHADEEEGFEDVGASGVLAAEQTGADKSPGATSLPSQTVTELPSTSTATEPKPEDQSNVSQPAEESTTPSSPSIGLPDQVDSMKLENEPQSEQKVAEKANQEPETSAPGDVPAPLFTKDPAADNTTDPVDQPAQGPVADEQREESIIMNDGGDEDSAEQYIQLDTDGQPVVGDYLKIQFVENKVVPTILGFFFRFPWNNFLHNVVYDVIQQVFNGPMERGYNRALAVNVFDTGRITTAIVEGQKRSDEAQKTKQIRLGYMGHLTLVAEEVVKFSERHPPELLSRSVMESVLNPDWIEYVEQILSETRERDNAILGGVRPDMSVGSRQTSLNNNSNNNNSAQGFSNSNALSDAGLNGGIGGSTFQSFDLNQGSVSGGAFGGGGTSLLSDFASSSDDEEDEEMEDQSERDTGNTEQGNSDDVSTSSASQPIPILPPPPAPLSLGPSRARRQLAARLAAQKQQSSETVEGQSEDREGSEDQETGWPTNPFVIAGVDDDNEGTNSAFPNSDFGSKTVHSPTFPESGFSPPDSLSTNSSEDENDGRPESVRRQVRVPLEVEDEDDDEMGEMVGPSSMGMMDSDDEDEAIINESLGYSNLSGPGRYNNFRRARAVSSHYEDEQNDSSDGEDDGLVEILVPGRKSSTSN
ncbi:unnamed protein product [Penicillium salamii]|uniref:SIT4 phosphatase-associated protein n=1 Tax=Penicillium salamii TaxID=1612424 RepID=A0A9W4K0M7_9EURO|nr:unnamed protein product [Penicillium salamii]CAG8112968.1 unnamed protein product [Penicillium salamii]CAG8145931.1 unnamed protein product [Penicillium salamii]CAG8171888.1 unnamed protein product [Penicillium salamii]CAG8342265.1 unnamed protein product [Penicillium salamii]